MDFIETHIHFGGREDWMLGHQHSFSQLRKRGLKKIFLLYFATYGLDYSQLIRFVPIDVRDHYLPDYVGATTVLKKALEEI